jgi:hypothetical protein
VGLEYGSRKELLEVLMGQFELEAKELLRQLDGADLTPEAKVYKVEDFFALIALYVGCVHRDAILTEAAARRGGPGARLTEGTTGGLNE